MRYYNNFNILKKDKGSIILIGNFDGLHLGHQKLFKLAKRYKIKKKKNIGVVTFDPIPKMFFNKKLINYKISNLNQKISLLKKFGVDFIINQKFNKKFSRLRSVNFIKNILNKKLKPEFIFVSNNFRFGFKRKGNVSLLKKFSKKFNFKIINPAPLKIKNKVVSSTIIRKNLEKGNLKDANKFLDRYWSIEGIVKQGRRMGKKIGFPTCNIELGNYIIAKPGVYAVRIRRKNHPLSMKGIANLGYRPTFNQKKILLEVNIFNFKGNLYNKHLIIDFTKFLRSEKKFKDISHLKKQINLDLKKAKKSF